MKRISGILSMILVLFLTSCGEKSADLTLLHWNDFHSKNIPWVPSSYNPDHNTVGGYAMFDAYLDALQDSFPNSLKIHAGDDFQGSPICSMTKGASQIEILNAVQPDFFTIGNHEFDYSWKNLDSLRRHLAGFDMYAANLVDSESGQLSAPGYKVFKRNGYRFALIGITHPHLDGLTLPENLEGISVLDPAEVVQDVINELKGQGIDLFIAVTHIGIGADKALAEAVPELDLIIGGHSHTYLKKALKVNGVYIVQADDHGRYVGVTRFHVENGDITSLNMDYVETVHGVYEPSEDVKKIVDNYEGKLEAVMNKQIGTLEIPWTRGGGETNIGSWMADAYRLRVGADVGIQNDGGIRKDLAAGPILVRDIWEIAPFGNAIVTFDMNGKDLLDAFDWMGRNRRSMQLSGVKLVLEKGAGLISATVGGKSIDPDKNYKIVTNNYTASHMDKYFGKAVSDFKETGLLDRDVLLDAVRKQKNIASRVEGRIIWK